MTFVCGPIKITVNIPRVWQPDGGTLIQTKKGQWRGNMHLPIGPSHVSGPFFFMVYGAHNAFQGYNYELCMQDGFQGRAQVMVGFSTPAGAASKEELPFIKWDLTGEEMDLTTLGATPASGGVWPQGLVSDQGKY